MAMLGVHAMSASVVVALLCCSIVALLDIAWSMTIRLVRLFGVDFTCPAIFRDGINSVSCIINSTAVMEAGCLPQALTFDRTLNSTPFTQCFVREVFNRSACNPSSTSDENTCWCNGYDGDIFTYKFVYKADQTKDAGAQLECNICSFEDQPLDVTHSEGCRNMSFNTPDLKDDSNVGVIVGVVAAVLLVSAITIGVFLLRRLRHKRLPVRKSVVLDGCTSDVIGVISN